MTRTLLLLAIALTATATSAQTRPASIPATPASRVQEDPNSIRVLLAPALETTLVSPFSGRVRQVSISIGQAFAKGRTLISFDCDEPVARMQMAEAELASARESHEAKLRLQGLGQAGEVEVSLSASAAERARAQVALYQAQLAQCSVTAPFSGRAVKVSVKSHQGVTQGQALLELVSDGPLKLRLNAPAKWATWLKPGTPFSVAIEETGHNHQAKVTAVNARIDAVSQSIELEAVIDGAARDLLPGMSGLARFNPPR